VYAIGRLALWTRADAAIRVTRLSDLTQPGIQHIAVANPKTAPYGAAAVASLTTLNLMPAVESKIVYAGNIQEALEFAETGNADVALTALSLVIGRPGNLSIVPDKLHPPIAQALGVAPSAPAEARRFADYLTGRDSAKIWRDSGYLLPRR
jgi:molybdate transport system substrate-binding protein